MATLLHKEQIGWARPHIAQYPSSEAKELEGELRKRIEGEVRFDDGSRALYATDGSNDRQVPIGVVIPKTVDDVVLTVEQCRRYGAPLLARGGGTSLAGQCCNVAVVLDFTKYLNKLIDLDPQARTARVRPHLANPDVGRWFEFALSLASGGREAVIFEWLDAAGGLHLPKGDRLCR